MFNFFKTKVEPTFIVESNGLVQVVPQRVALALIDAGHGDKIFSHDGQKLVKKRSKKSCTLKKMTTQQL